MIKKQIAVNESGRRIGEDAPHARLSNKQVDLMLDDHDGGMGYKRLAKKYNASIRTVRDIVSFKRRSQTVAGWKMVLIESHNDRRRPKCLMLNGACVLV